VGVDLGRAKVASGGVPKWVLEASGGRVRQKKQRKKKKKKHLEALGTALGAAQRTHRC
jgi:hypothetical protein